MAALFETTEINGMTLDNRLVRSATWEGMCQDNGRPTQKLIDYCREHGAERVFCAVAVAAIHHRIGR